jgi:hypothetical protein
MILPLIGGSPNGGGARDTGQTLMIGVFVTIMRILERAATFYDNICARLTIG